MKLVNKIVGWSLLAFLVLTVYVWNFGLWPRNFDIAWDEEVQLHDGRVIVVHIKNTYRRLGFRLYQYDDAIATHGEIAFDSESKFGTIVLRTGLGVPFIDLIDDQWYIVLSGQGPDNRPEEPGEFWGHDFTQTEKRLAVLRDGKFVPSAWELAPNSIQNRNLLFTGMSIKELVDISKKRITLDIKQQLKIQYPPHPEAREISRPLRMKQPQGENK